jgi:hypothetical protein
MVRTTVNLGLSVVDNRNPVGLYFLPEKKVTFFENVGQRCSYRSMDSGRPKSLIQGDLVFCIGILITLDHEGYNPSGLVHHSVQGRKASTDPLWRSLPLKKPQGRFRKRSFPPPSPKAPQNLRDQFLAKHDDSHPTD